MPGSSHLVSRKWFDLKLQSSLKLRRTGRMTGCLIAAQARNDDRTLLLCVLFSCYQLSHLPIGIIE